MRAHTLTCTGRHLRGEAEALPLTLEAFMSRASQACRSIITPSAMGRSLPLSATPALPPLLLLPRLAPRAREPFWLPSFLATRSCTASKPAVSLHGDRRWMQSITCRGIWGLRSS